MPQWDAWMAGLADVLGPLLLDRPPEASAPAPEGPARHPPPGLAPARSERAHRGRRHPADDHEHRRPPRRLVRVVAGEGAHRRQRRHRHLGRPLRAGHRLRHGAPLHRGHRRRPPGQLGLPRRRHGRRWPAPSSGRPAASAPRSAPTPGWPASWWPAAGSAGVVLDSGEEILAPVVVTTLHPRTAFLDHVGRRPAARRLRRATSRTGRPAAASSRSTWPSPNSRTSRPTRARPRQSTTPVRWRWRRRWSTSSAPSRTPARAGRPTRPFSDGVIPTTFDKTLCPDGTHIMSLFTQWVPHELERTSRTPRSSRPTPTG